MTTPEAATMTELIEDCADIPRSITHAEHPLPAPRAAASWEVDDTTARRFEGINEYGV
ncbi:hypothetical protein [Umezawaea tangerina]|nr:hypothetical protein [Umezawaea tangerina]